MAEKNVLVVGTGTIGEPLTGLLAVLQDDLGIDNVFFYKHTPRLRDRPLIKGLIRKGGHFVYDPKQVAKMKNTPTFEDLGLKPEYEWHETLEMSDVVIDCTKSNIGLRNKEEYYLDYQDTVKGFLAQGSEHGFGIPFATGINNRILAEKAQNGEKFFQVVSCNTHVLSAVLRNVAMETDKNCWPSKSNHVRSRFVIMRRAADISQAKNFVQAPTISPPDDDTFGSHHARDVNELYNTLGYDLDLYSTALKLNTPFMHTVHFSIEIDNDTITKQNIVDAFMKDPLVAVTHKKTTNQVFSVGREHGFYGRILDQAVVALPTLHVRKANSNDKNKEIIGIAFTPQDGNSLLSSLAATLSILYDHDLEEVNKRMDCIKPYQFTEV